ncbi:MAG TPA: MarR family transcriptional regulator [Longimicrobiales bacterium]|jgi:tetratricopeptide (TPR) repeat protein
MKAAFLSRFTPSLLRPEALERMFVQRSMLARTIVEGLRESSMTPNKHYYLVTGPRGIGKTHLVSLIHHRLRQDDALQDKLRIAWLREEEWGVASYLDLLLVILRAIHEAGDTPELAESYERLRALDDPAQACAMAERLVVEVASTGTLLIIAENLEEIFRGIELDGQHRLRALIQNHPVFSILGTAQSLFDGVTSRTEPFYGFFDTHQLEELTFENSVQLVSRIAEQEGNQKLSEFLASPGGRARMRAVHHLGAGNPRVYVIFSQFLTSSSLDELVNPLLQTLDDLTPYYQSRMGHLSPQQRKIVEYLCEHRGAATVTKIASANFITPQTVSGQLRKLDELGYVRSTRHGRASYYELREPLLRLTLEVKKLRGEPVRLIVEFLRVWYSARELSERLGATAAPEERSYVEAALEMKRRHGEGPILEACRNDLARFVDAGDTARALGVAEELLAVGETIEDMDQVIRLEAASPEQVAKALVNKGLRLDTLGRYEEAMEIYDDVVRRFGERPEGEFAELVAMALSNKGLTLASLGRFGVAGDAIERASDVLAGNDDGLLRNHLVLVPRLLTRTAEPAWRQIIPRLIQSMERRGQLTALGVGLVQSIRPLAGDLVSRGIGARWLSVWTELSEAHDQMRIPLRLLKAAVSYLADGNAAALQALPREERDVLKTLLPVG